MVAAVRVGHADVVSVRPVEFPADRDTQEDGNQQKTKKKLRGGTFDLSQHILGLSQ